MPAHIRLATAGVAWLKDQIRNIEREIDRASIPLSTDTVTQATSKATAVTLDGRSGTITLNSAALAAGTIVTFVLNNSTLTANDQIVCTHHDAGTFGAYTVNSRVTGAGAASIAVRNNTAGSLSEAIVLKFTVHRALVA